MPIQVAWSIEHDDVLNLSFEGDWSWEDFYRMGNYARTLMHLRASTVHVVYDLRKSTAMLRSPVLHLRHFAMHLPENGRTGLHAYIGATTFWKSCLTAFTRVYPDLAPDIVYVSNPEDAWTAIERKKEQLELLADEEPV